MTEWQPIETAPRDGTWFFARTEHGTVRHVRFDDEYDRYPIGNDGEVWSTDPIEWTSKITNTPERVMCWRSPKSLTHCGTWATTRYPDSAVEYTRTDITNARLAEKDAEIAILKNRIDQLIVAWGRDVGALEDARKWGVRVKPLVWDAFDVRNDWSDPPQTYPHCWVSETSIGRYDIHRADIDSEEVWSLRNPEYFRVKDFPLADAKDDALEAAKATAQADYQSRIFAALEPPHDPE